MGGLGGVHVCTVQCAAWSNFCMDRCDRPHSLQESLDEPHHILQLDLLHDLPTPPPLEQHQLLQFCHDQIASCRSKVASSVYRERPSPPADLLDEICNLAATGLSVDP